VTGPVRLAGGVRRGDGTHVTWTLAEGRKGRRWREVVTGDDGGMRWALLYETDPDGGFSHLELASAAGLATLHPEGDGTLHGNVVEPEGGVRHIVGAPFEPGNALLVAGSLVAGAAVAAGHRPRSMATVLDPVDLTLDVRVIVEGDLTSVDEAGVPLLPGGATWPLER
jgi:hypothetical protein